MKCLFSIFVVLFWNMTSVRCQDKSGLFIVDYNVLDDYIIRIKYFDTSNNIRYDIGLNNVRSYFSVLYFHDSENIKNIYTYENGQLIHSNAAILKGDSSLIYINPSKDFELGKTKTALRYNDAHQLVEAKLKEDKRKFLRKRKVVYWHKYYYLYCFPLKISMDIDKNK